MNTLNENQHADHPGITAQHHDQQNEAPGASKTKDDLPPAGPAIGSAGFEDGLKRDGVPGHEDQNLSIHSIGTNPGTEYLPPLNDYGEHLSR
ncbi:hypothetical protein [Pedobacter heparinus]|uniref:hypothetical protein n=1 Tax=Pedobacter heparinus TaxID=984 RepID=UPI00293067D5|nr:hypothetical protein [Pedobacter heparinus]